MRTIFALHLGPGSSLNQTFNIAVADLESWQLQEF
jgi:hypothetical protein